MNVATLLAGVGENTDGSTNWLVVLLVVLAIIALLLYILRR